MIVSEDFHWEKLCITAAKKANEILGTVKRNFVDRSN